MRFACKEWLPALGSLCAVIAAVIYALARTMSVSDEIASMDKVAIALSASANDVQKGVHSADEISAAAREREELELRMADSQKPGLVVSQLSEDARAAGLQVLEIQPLATPGQTDKSRLSLPNYRVSLKGAYQEIARYLEGCASQRIPVRVVGLELGRMDEANPNSSGDELRADIVVEAYQPREKQAGSASNAS